MTEQKMTEEERRIVLNVDDSNDDSELVRIAFKKIPGFKLINVGDLESFGNALIKLQPYLCVVDGYFPSAPGKPEEKNWENAVEFVNSFSPNSKVLLFSGSLPTEQEWKRYECIIGAYDKNRYGPTSFRDFVRPYL